LATAIPPHPFRTLLSPCQGPGMARFYIVVLRVMQGESRSPGGENNITVWSNTLLVFTPLHPGRPECKELVVSGRGFSQWRGRSIFFLVRGQAEVGGGFSLLKQHVGEYTNSIAYEGIFAGGDPTDTAAIPTLEGEYVCRSLVDLARVAGPL